MNITKDSHLSKDKAFAAGQSHRERDYWLNRLSGDLEKTIIPHDGQKNGTKGDEPRTDIVEFGFHEELFSRLMQLSNKSDYRLYILMVTGLVLLIYKYTAQKDIIVASPTYRQDVENELINTILVLRNRVKTGLTIKEFLLQIAESIFEADENQNYPIETLLYKLNLPDTLEDLPFTDIAILLENVHDRSYLKQTRFNMLFTFCRKADGFEGRLEYNGGLYEKNFIERLIVHFTNLLRQCLFGLDLKVADIDILNNQEKEQLLEDFNGKKVDFPRTGSIDRYVEAHAGQTPDRVAVGFEDSHLTYRCLNGMAGQLAAALRASGIGEDCLVGIMADRSPLVMACILAVWKAGGAYIPIDCDYPTGRIIEILQDSGARILFTWARHVDLTLEKKHKEKIMLLDHFFAGAATTAETLPDPDFKININSLAYVIYTSGSTGKPKGVMVEHLGMINHIQVKIIDLQLSAQSIVAQNSSYTFDISVWQFFAALIPGGKTVIYPYTLIIEPNHFIDRITRDRVTVLEVVPSYLAVILEVSAANFKRIESLRYLLVTGEELKHHLVEQWFETYPGIIMVNAYGPTEASDDITHYIMDRKSNHKPVPIGLPLPNMGLYILDQDMKLCPIGIKGEIYVSGVGVGRGYLNDQNKTARAFIISSIGKDGQVRKVRLYKTGDLGAWLPDGNIQFFGRKDHQVKIRGYRIELEEIEWNLTAYPSIKKAVVMERKNPRGIQSLCAYLVPHERLDIPRIREYLSQRLPAYMVPDYFIELDRIPLTPNGKIDRKALSEVKIQSPLGLPFISEGMLKKGINSTLSRKSQVQRLTVEETEKSHDNVIRTLGKEHSDLQICLEKMADSRTHYSLSYPQRMMYYIEKRSPGTACNNVVYTIKYPGKINCSLLEQAINHVLYKNEALRLRVVEIEHESSLAFAQYVSDYIPIKIDQFDFSGKENEMTLAEWLKTNACRGFYSLDSDLFYFAYIQFDEKTSGYYLKLHHIICDAVSIHFLIKEINKIYQHLQSGKSIGNEKNPSYLEYISFEQEYLTSGRAKADMQFWLDYLLPPSQEVQLSERMAEEGNTRAHMLKLQFPQSLNREIYRYCDNYKTTLYRLILAALGIYISRACAVNDMVIGTLNNNRSLFKYTRMFGIFIGFIPLRIKVDGDIAFNDFVKSIGANINRIINNHHEFPFEIIASQLGERGVDHRYFSNVNLISHPDLEIEDVAIERLFTGFDAAPLSIYINRANRGIHGVIELDWVFQAGRFLETEVQQFHHCLVNILTDALVFPGKPAGEIELLTIEEKNHILNTFNRNRTFPKVDIPLDLPGNPHFYILNEKEVLQPVGIPGELCAGIDNIDLQAEKLNPDPFQERGWLYRTRELGVWQPDGNIKLLGRIEHQIHLKGRRIDPRVLENYLLKFTGIQEAVVTTQYNNGNPYLCAFITTKKDPTKSGLIEYLTNRFPLYMIPENFVILEEMPMAGNGSVDRRLLEQVDLRAAMEVEHLKPGTVGEKKLAGIWAEVLAIEKDEISLNSNFFELGGHSLNATILVSKIHRAFNVKISLADIFKLPELAKLSGYIQGLAKEKYESIQPVEKKEYYALSSAQQRLCILQHMYLDSTGYNLPHHFYLPEETDIGKLDDTFHKLINRHESLRTSFHMIADKPVQRIHENVEFKIEHLDLAALDDAGLTSVIQDGGLISLIHYSFIRPFDLSRAPLLRAGWTKLENQQYLLMVDMHHIISDGISHDILLKDFMALYKGDGLPPLRIQYKEFSQWQHHEKENEGIKQQKNYWLKVFAGEIPVLQIPSDYPRPEIQDFAGISVDAAINPEKSGLLKQYAVREGVTLYMLFLAVTNILFSKLSGQEDIVAGTPVAGRRHADLELIIGMFVNTLPMRNYPVGDKTFKQFLAEVKTRTLEAFDNQEYPFEDMVDQVGVNRDAGRNPLFDVMFALQNNDNRQVPVLDEDTFRIGHTRSKFDITITAFESRENISFNFIYNTALFKIETIKRFIGCFKKIILAITPECDTKLFHIEIISTEEKRQLLNEFNDTGTAYPQEKTIHQLFGEQVSKTPDNIAVVGSTLGVETLGAASLKIQMSYHQLDEQSNCLAGLLIEKGLLPDNIVAIMVERSIEMIIGIMGIFKSGGAYLPIDPGYPQERIDYMLKDSNAAVLLIANEEKIIDNRQLSIVNTQFSTGESPCNFHHSAFITPHSNPFHLCYIIYTSGTTGKPKGAMIEQRGMVNHIYAKIHDLQLDNRSVVAQNASQMFDISVWQLFAALIVGGRTVIIPNEIIREPMNFMAHILDSKINILEVVPSYLAALLDIPSRANSYSSLPLKYLLVTGEAINPDLLKKWFSKYPGIKVVNAYGPTEASDDITHYIMHKAPEMNRVPIGSPVQNMYIYIVDKYMTLCPLGVPGELYVAGTGIGRGYLNRPELTADRFKRNVISRWSFVNGKFQTDNNPLNLTNDYFYRTGDLAYWLNDGNIVFLGRIDHQVKIRGFRIELGEIENQLITYPGIKEAVVTANEYESGNGDKYLAAYFVSAVKLEIPVLREYLLKNLPDYMVPAYFIALEKIPLTPNGKIDRKALPPPEITTGIGFTAPGNELEAKLVEIWAEVLGMEENIIGINDNFFHLGGHSLKAIIMTQRVHKELYVKLPLTEVFKTPTIRGLTGFIKKSSGDNFVSLDPVELKEYYPLSSTQKRMYVAQQMDLHSKSYNMPTALELEGELNKEKLTGVFKKLLQRHDSLRTSFLMLEEGPVQRILNAADITFNLENYETMGNKSLEREIITHFLRPFVLSKAPLLRAGLIKKDKEKYMLIVDQHHIISDGISMSILITDFTDFYQDKELLPLRIQYKDFSEWQNRLLESGNMKKQEDYWLDIFKVVVPVLNIPTDYPRPAVRNINKGETIEFRLEEGLCRQLNHLVKETNTTIFIVLLAVYNVLLFKYTGQEDIIVGSPITGRSHVDLQNVIGVFLNMLAIRNRPQQRKVFRDFLKEVKENALDAFENQDYPFDELVKKLKLQGETGRNPLFDTEFAINYMEPPRGELPGLKIKPSPGGNKFAKFDLHFLAVESNGNIRIILRYYTSLFKRSTIEKMLGHYVEIAEQVVTNPGIKCEDIVVSLDISPVQSNILADVQGEFDF